MKILKKAILEPWKVLSSELVLDNPWFRVRKDSVHITQKNIKDDFFVWEESNHSLIVPVTKDLEFVMIRQYKHGSAEVVTEFPCGLVDDQESFLQTAQRELLEEAACESTKWSSLGRFTPSASKSVAQFEIFLAEGCSFRSDYQIGLADHVEEIEIISYPYNEIKKIVSDNSLPCGKSTLAFLLAEKVLSLA